MAIIVEEEKKTSNLSSLLGWLVLLIAIAAGSYYLFFAAPAPAVVAPPAGFANITPITQINIDPQSVINSQAFTVLKQSVSEPSALGPAPIGRQNPFLAP